MKINIDLSNSELVNAMASIQHSVKETAVLRQALSARDNELWNLRNEKDATEQSLRFLREDMEVLKGEAKFHREENTRLQASAIEFSGEVPSHTMTEMGNLLVLARKAQSSPDAQFLLALIACVRTGSKIQAIKMVRQSCNCGLREAKDLVEVLAFNQGYAGASYGTEVADAINSALHG